MQNNSAIFVVFLFLFKLSNNGRLLVKSAIDKNPITNNSKNFLNKENIKNDFSDPKQKKTEKNTEKSLKIKKIEENEENPKSPEELKKIHEIISFKNLLTLNFKQKKSKSLKEDSIFHLNKIKDSNLVFPEFFEKDYFQKKEKNLFNVFSENNNLKIFDNFYLQKKKKRNLPSIFDFNNSDLKNQNNLDILNREISRENFMSSKGTFYKNRINDKIIKSEESEEFFEKDISEEEENEDDFMRAFNFGDSFYSDIENTKNDIVSKNVKIDIKDNLENYEKKENEHIINNSKMFSNLKHNLDYIEGIARFNSKHFRNIDYEKKKNFEIPKNIFGNQTKQKKNKIGFTQFLKYLNNKVITPGEKTIKKQKSNKVKKKQKKNLPNNNNDSNIPKKSQNSKITLDSLNSEKSENFPNFQIINKKNQQNMINDLLQIKFGTDLSMESNYQKYYFNKIEIEKFHKKKKEKKIKKIKKNNFPFNEDFFSDFQNTDNLRTHNLESLIKINESKYEKIDDMWENFKFEVEDDEMNVKEGEKGWKTFFLVAILFLF